MIWSTEPCENGYAINNLNLKYQPVYISSENPQPIKNEIRFHGTMEEFKRYLPELYEKMVNKEQAKL